MLKYFQVEQLNGVGTFETVFNPDLNVLTGRNGAGKTTVLKLLWYLISGNIDLALREVVFSRATIETSNYKMTIVRRSDSPDQVMMEQGPKKWEFIADTDDDGFSYGDSPIEQANGFAVDIGSSLFFPTFRRIEGGFGIKPRRLRRTTRGALEDAMQELANKLSNNDHTFVASISTADIVNLAMRKYTEISEQSNVMQEEVSQNIITRIKSYKREVAESESSRLSPSPHVISSDAEKMLDEIKSSIEELDSKRQSLLTPFNVVRDIVMLLFKHTGISLSPNISFGDAADAVNSDHLSAGEKQMLSFICYNGFYNNSTIFVDEPELSLHVDWQRQLFPTLLNQKTNNQFIIATHSPFIYSKYPDKEIAIHPDRGE